MHIDKALEKLPLKGWCFTQKCFNIGLFQTIGEKRNKKVAIVKTGSYTWVVMQQSMRLHIKHL